MKKITLKIFMIMCLLGTYVGVSQTLNQAANWPNAAWTLSGSYDVGGLAGDPTTTGASFIFDDDAAGNGSSDNIIATSPVIDLTAASMAGETWITVSGNFTYYALGGDVLAIEVYDADAMTWSAIQTFTGNTTTVADYQNCTISEAYTSSVLDISGFTAGQLSGFQYRVSYDDQAGWQYGWCIESPTITSAAPPSCFDPSMLTASNITDTTADLGWTETGTAMVWDVEIVTNGTPPTGTPTASTAMNPYGASGLTAETAYDFYVRADCGPGGTSNWVGPLTFTTNCAPINAPYVEDFETFTATPGVAFVSENCWGATNTGASYFWESALGSDTSSGGTGPSPTITTGNYFFTEASGSSIGDVAELNSPLVDLTPLTDPALTFNYHMFGGQIGTLDVVVNGTTTVWTLSGQQQATETTPWELAVVDLAAYAGQQITVTFRATGAGTFEGDIAIDNPSFTELPACPTPSALTATNIMETTADLGWTENGVATTWNIELVDVTAGGSATGTPTVSGVMTNPYNATGLVGDNSYQFYVQADCGVDGTSAWAGPFSFNTPYVAVPPDCTNGIFLDSGGSAGNYSDNENITYTICPDMAGDAVNVEFTFFSTENNGATACYDGLTIHDGPDNTAPTIDPAGGGTIWCFDRNDMPAVGTGDLQGMTIVSSDPSGCLTFVFTSDGSVQRPGWEANVSCAPLSIESAEVRGFVHYVDTVNNAFVVNAQSTIASIEVYNLVGQMITTSKPNAAAGEANLGSVKNGVFFARVTLENGRTSVVKFVK